MLHLYSNLYFPICSIIIAIAVFILYYSKRNIKNKETELYSKLVIITLIEALFTFGLTLCVHLFFKDSTEIYFAFANKILYIIYIIWITILFLYFVKISYEEDEEVKVWMKVSAVMNIILIICILFSKIDLVYNKEELVSNSYGIASNFLYIGCAIYIFLMTIVSLINFKYSKNYRKYMPLLVLIIMMIVTMVIRIVDPFCNMTSNVVSLITLLMYFTIENPDLKMLKELQIAYNRAEKSDKVKSEFISSMSHEIRTPINAIYGYSQLIEYAENLEEAKENAGQIKESSEILVKMVSNILDIFKIESNEITSSNNSYNPYNEFNDLLDLFEDKIASKNLSLKRDIIPNIPIVYGDINILKKVLINVLDNAIKYTDKGIITFKVDTNIKDDKCELKIIIEDTGRGIKEKDLKNIFEYFERGENKDSSINGLGLGLPLSKKLIEMIDGKLEITSVYNKGTKVVITLVEDIVKE